MTHSAIRAAGAAVALLAAFPLAAEAQRVLLYCPTIAADGQCGTIEAALRATGSFTQFDKLRFASGTAQIQSANGNLNTVGSNTNLSVYTLVFVPSFADPVYDGLRNTTSRSSPRGDRTRKWQWRPGRRLVRHTRSRNGGGREQ
jgi:hypothetical protein